MNTPATLGPVTTRSPAGAILTVSSFALAFVPWIAWAIVTGMTSGFHPGNPRLSSGGGELVVLLVVLAGIAVSFMSTLAGIASGAVACGLARRARERALSLVAVACNLVPWAGLALKGV